MIPVELGKYDQRIVLEALHNCIAHQDYTRCERVLVIERPTELVFQNAGTFFDGIPRTTSSPIEPRPGIETVPSLRRWSTCG